MAARNHKPRKTSSKKAASSDLPSTKLATHPPFLKRDPWLHGRNTAPLGITKSWIPTTSRCGARQRPQLYQVLHVSLSPSPNPYPNNHFLGDSSSITEAAIEMPHASHWCLLESNLTARTHPPPTTTPDHYINLLGPSLRVNGVSISSDSRSSLMVGYTVCRCSYAYVYRYVSIRYECTTADPFDAKRKLIEFSSVVKCGGKFYATSLQGALVVMQVSGTRLKITGVSASRAVPSMSCMFFKEYLVETKGEILLVFLIHEKSLAVA